MFATNDQNNRFLSKLIKNKHELKEPYNQKGLLDIDDRISEILTGIIMILTFTCTYSVIKSDRTTVIDMLIGAICSTMAWGFIDAIIYLFMAMINKEHNYTFLNFVRKSTDINKAHKVIVDDLPAEVVSFMQPEEIEAIRKKILNLPEPSPKLRLNFSDYKIAIGIFFLVFFSTIPISIPFILIKNLQVALRISNIIAILMLFVCGWTLGKYAGRNRFFLGIVTCLIGIVLVSITILFGG
jgi:hypothetical protein